MSLWEQLECPGRLIVEVRNRRVAHSRFAELVVNRVGSPASVATLSQASEKLRSRDGRRSVEAASLGRIARLGMDL